MKGKAPSGVACTQLFGIGHTHSITIFHKDVEACQNKRGIKKNTKRTECTAPNP
jgi:hypothetical protein